MVEGRIVMQMHFHFYGLSIPQIYLFSLGSNSCALTLYVLFVYVEAIIPDSTKPYIYLRLNSQHLDRVKEN